MATETNIPTGNAVATEGASLCWSCNAALAGNAHFCPNCGKVQPSTPIDYFEFFSLGAAPARKLDIDLPALEREFYRLSRKLHPDVFARASTREQQWSLEKSSQLNDAYRTLKDPIARTQYLLELEGVKLEEQSSAATLVARTSGEEKKQVVPPELLEEVFELNMQLQEMRMNKEMGEDDPAIVSDLQNAKSRFETMLDDLTSELKSYWNEWDATISAPGSSESDRIRVRDKLVDLLNRRSYIRNLVRDVNQALAG
ncbi:MAG: heat shock protein DnaJ-like protein [Candidatus Angelobacter sp.]|jgi:molecular chaperone HscB|nr:heat shock protein DnaJ-like protein [Candidatus Angelobacter sp.]